MTLFHATKLIACFFGIVSARCWAVSAVAPTRIMRRMLPWTADAGLPSFQSTMNALAAGAASIAAIAQVFITLPD
ncbi:hypothetical protein [Methylobacterium radiotolerans]|uniref:hypothetical protein n=1 Tax=Methylobacterium radiotolerans TaxID=31998 RepID=UPI00059E0A97|nr:hypothetical protein [Methylobacterium radiotolerans]GEN01535.1 hypothetical protein MRA01_60740 [Methylobacterium radiotolerans]